MARRKSIEAWITEAMADDEAGTITMIALVHMSGPAQEEIHNIKFGGNKKWTGDQIGKLFTAKAETYCQDLRGVHTFQVLVFYNGESQPATRYPFVVNSIAALDNANGLFTEPPTNEGRTQQKMRWDETVLQQTYRKQQQIDDTLMRMNNALIEMNQTLMQENRDAFVIVKEMLMAKALDDHSMCMKELEHQRSTEERAKLLKFAPALVNTISGREVFPQSTADTALIETIADSLSLEQVMAIAQHLPPPLVGVLMTRLEQIEKAKNAKRQLAKRNGTNGKPEDNAAGD
jgi:hypothetical protein